MEDLSIAEESRECIDLFKGFDDVFNPEEHDDGLQARFVVGEQAARFRIWAGQFGVFAKAHGSMDHRLRDNISVKQSLLDQLSECRALLERMICHAKQEERQELNVHVDFSDLELGLNQSSTNSSSLSSVSDSTAHSSTYYSTNPVLSEELRNIEQTIDRLYRMSAIIRAHSFTNHGLKAAEKFVLKGEDGSDISEVFKDYAATMIRLRCPAISEGLLARLSNAVLLRRKRFEFSKRHQSKLDVLGLVQTNEQKNPTVPMTASPLRPTVTLRPSEKGIRHPRQRNDDRELLSTTTVSQSPTLARMPDLSWPDRPISTVVRDPSLWATALDIPPPPKIPSLAKEFQCPYCFMMLSSTEATSRKWIDHVLKDVEPYVCVMEHCDSETLIFPDQQSWIAHLKDHTVTWVCNSPEHGPSKFSSGEAYELHVKNFHWDGNTALSTTQLQFLKRWAERRSDTPLANCPFCPFEISAEVTQTVQASSLLEHVQKHLRSAALISLPWRDDVDVEPDDSVLRSTSQKDNSSQDDLQSFSKEFQDVGSTSRPGDEENLMIHERTTASEGATLDDEWGFIQSPAYYMGHELDPILQRFLKEMYLGITRSSSASRTLRGAALPCYLVPSGNDRGCLGREPVIREMEQVLCPTVQFTPSTPPGSGELEVFALCGPGGMGKTSVAREFIQRYQDRFDVVLWFHGDSRTKLLHDFRQAAIKLQLVAKESIDSKDQILTCDLVKRFLISPRKPNKKENKSLHDIASWLVVFDGVDEPDLLKEFWPYGGPGSILITSRDPLPFSKVRELGPLDTADSARLLLHLTGRDKVIEDKQLAIDIARKVEGFPLALTHLASLINRRQWSFLKFINAYEKREGEEALSPTEDTQDAYYKYNLASTWGLENLRFGHTLLEVLSMLDPDSIPESLLTTHIGRVQMDDYPSSMNEFKRAKIELLQSSLIFENRSTNSISLHRLVTDVTRTRMSQDRYRLTFLKCTKIISAIWPYEDFTWRHGVERWSECEKLFPHVHRLLELSEPVQIAGDELDGHYEFAKLLTDASWYNHERGGSDESVKFSRYAQGILETILSKTRDQHTHTNADLRGKVKFTLAEIQHNRGCFATETNEPQDALLHHTAFHDLMLSESPHDRLPAHDMRLAISWNELGTALMLNDRWTDGERCFEKAISAVRALEKFDPLQLSLPLVNLGLAYWITGRSTDAANILLRGLVERELAFGIDDQDSFITGRFLHALGNVKTTQGYLSESFEYHRRALLQYKSTLGNNHHRTADLCVRVAFHHLRMRHLDLSLALLNQALKVYGDTEIFRRERLRVRYTRSKVFRAQNKFVEADAETQWCLHKYREITGEDRKSLIDSELDRLIVFWSR